jgi:ABC-type branched-subunit amino acid transport system substrate-binding protein
MQPVSGLNAARKFIEDSQVVALTGFGSETVSAISSSVEKSRIPGIFVTPDRRPIEGKQYLFRHWVDGKDMLPILVSELQRRGIKSVALVYSEIPAMTGFGTYAEQELPVAGFKIAYKNSILPSEMDFRTISAAIRSSKADGVIYFLLPPQPSPFMKQLRQVNPALPVFSFINTENSEEIKSANGALEGVTYPGPSFTKDFIDRFEKRFGEFPEFAAGNVYDIIKIYGNALASGACSRDEFRAFISEVHNFSGALGTYSITDKNDFRFPVRLKVIKEGRFVEFVADK